MKLLAPSDAIVPCPMCGQQFRRVSRNGNVSFFDVGLESDPGSRCPFGDQARTTGPSAGPAPATRTQSTPDGCLKDLVVKIHELHQLERRAYDGAMLSECDCAAKLAAGLCSADTSSSISCSCRAFVTISACLATFMQSREDPEHMCPACGHASREPACNGHGLCAECVASGL